MSLAEFFVTLFYILLFYVYVRYRAGKMQENQLKRYFIRAFWLKVLASVLFMIYYTYLTGGDTRSLYFTEGKNLYNLVLHDGENWKYIFGRGTEFNTNLISNPYNVGYFLHESNYLIIKLTALLCVLSFGFYTPVGIFFAMFAFSGIFKLFLFFYEQRPQLIKAFAVSILFFPSVIFWSSGLMKDSLCIGALGWLTYSLFKLIHRKKIFSNTVILLISVYLLAEVKIYILLAYAPLFLLYILLKKLQAIKVTILKYVISIFVLIGITIVFSQIYEGNNEELNTYALENLAGSVAHSNEIFSSMAGRQDAESTFDLGAEYDGTAFGLVKIAPFALAATFFRPFIWETRKVSQLLAALESIILVWFTLKIFMSAPFKFVKYVLSDPLILFCILFAFIFGLFVGTSTLNFGTLVRYKIPCMPFYAAALFLIYSRIGKTKEVHNSRNQIMQVAALQTT